MHEKIFSIIAPVLLIAIVGYIWRRKRMPFDTAMITDLVTYIGAPSLLFSSLLINRPDFTAISQIVGATLLIAGVVAVMGAVFLKILDLPFSTYLPSMFVPNVGNMGLPLCLFAFGEEGLTLAVAYYAASSVLQFTAGVSIASGKISSDVIFRNPVIWAIIAAFVLLYTDVELPKWIANTTDVLAGFVIPLMLLSLGASLGHLKVETFGRSFGLAMFRLIIGFGIGLIVATAFGLQGPVRGVVIIQSAMPTAVFTYLFATRAGTCPEEVGGIVVISTVLSFITLPFLLAFVLG
ncbi:MAG: transporter [Candidatus Marinimicrobia bacterium]|nr:transporter [Candidatus Neomarinimicrobiota bacterium]